MAARPGLRKRPLRLLGVGLLVAIVVAFAAVTAGVFNTEPIETPASEAGTLVRESVAAGVGESAERPQQRSELVDCPIPGTSQSGVRWEIEESAEFSPAVADGLVGRVKELWQDEAAGSWPSVRNISTEAVPEMAELSGDSGEFHLVARIEGSRLVVFASSPCSSEPLMAVSDRAEPPPALPDASTTLPPTDSLSTDETSSTSTTTP